MLMDGLQYLSSVKWKAGKDRQLENVESKFDLTKCFRQGSVDAPTLWLK